MHELFPGFYERTLEEISNLWKEATFVFDTNMLLNVYQYKEELRSRFFEILEQLRDRIWIPYQVALEYEDNRMDVINRQVSTYKAVSKKLDEAHDILSSLDPLKQKHPLLNIDELTSDAKRDLSNAKVRLNEDGNVNRRNLENLRTSDDRRERIYQLFQGRIGEPYRADKLLSIFQIADRRIELRIPPGWQDRGKGNSDKPYRKYGDIILWFQMIEYARPHHVAIIFITDDEKSDWYLSREESRGSIRPQPELVQEMLIEANVLIHMYTGYKFIDEATKFLHLEEKPDVIEEAKAVTEENTLENNVANEYIRLFSNEEELNSAFIKWLRDTYPSRDIRIRYPTVGDKISPKFDFLLILPDNTRIFFELLYYSSHGLDAKSILNNVNRIINDRLKTLMASDKLTIIIVTDDFLYASHIFEELDGKISMESNTSLVIGYINGQLHVVNTIPHE